MDDCQPLMGASKKIFSLFTMRCHQPNSKNHFLSLLGTSTKSNEKKKEEEGYDREERTSDAK